MNANLSIHSITKTFKGGEVIANNNISTQFSLGTITALIGHNGAGKTTLLNQIMGITKPDQGSVTFAGRSFVTEPYFAREMIAIMPQFHAPLSGVKLRQAIEAILRIRGLSGPILRKKIERVLTDLKIEDWADTPGEKLSGGLQRLTSFAMTIAAPPPILLFDEPTNDVDPVRRKLIWRYMKKLASDGHIVIVVTHNLLEVEQYTDRYLLLDHGKLINDSATDNLKNSLSSTCVLSVNTEHSFSDIELPNVKQKIVRLEDQQYDFFLSQDQVGDAVAWLQQKINNDEISNYSLTPYSLDALYGGLTDGD